MPESGEETRGRELSRLMALAASGDAGQFAEAIATLAGHMSQDADSDLPMLWHALWQSAEYYAKHRRYSVEQIHLVRLKALSDKLGDPVLSARAYVRLADNYHKDNEGKLAVNTAQQAYDLARKLPPGQADADFVRALTTLVAAEAEFGDPAEAIMGCDQLLEAASQVPAPVKVRAQRAAAIAYARAEDYEMARTAIEAAMDAMDSHEDPVLWLRVRIAAASFYLELTPPSLDLAAEVLDDFRHLVRYVGSPRHAQETLLLEARLAAAQGDHQQAQSIVAELSDQEPFLNDRDLSSLDILYGQLRIAANRPRPR